jgi:Nucleoside-diphosphate-sugar epimerases
MAKTLIIGGSRFLGPALIRRLIARGHEVTVFNRGNNYGQTLPRVVRVLHGDRTKAEDMRELLQEPYDYIYDMCCYDADDAKKLVDFAPPTAHIIF